jgi:4-hydroxybenzoate polyprenyltransferase
MESESFKGTIRMLGPIAWLALAAALQMLGALLFFRLPIDLILIFSAAFITFGVYLLNRFTDDEDSFNYPDQKFYFQNKNHLKAIPILLIAFSIFILLVTARLVPWHVFLIIGGILYSINIIPAIQSSSLRFIRLKDVLLLKNLSVSVFWGMSSLIIASGQKGAVIPAEKTDLFIIAAAFCLTTLINTTTCDVRDIEGDRLAGVRTLATYLGEKAVGLILLSLGVSACLFVSIHSMNGRIGRGAALLFFSSVLWTCFVALPLYLKRLNLPKLISEPLIDTQQVFCGVALIVLSIA